MILSLAYVSVRRARRGTRRVENDPKQEEKRKKKIVLTGQFFMFFKVTQTTGKQSITEQKQWDKGAILNPRSFFARGMREEAEETFCAEGQIYVDIFQWNKISWVCKFHSHHISTRSAGRKSADLTFQHMPPPPNSGRTWFLALQIDGDVLRITSRLKFMITAPSGGVAQRRVYCFISLNASHDLHLRHCQGISKKEAAQGLED